MLLKAIAGRSPSSLEVATQQFRNETSSKLSTGFLLRGLVEREGANCVKILLNALKSTLCVCLDTLELILKL